jgi:hypothetical protein
MKISYGMTIKLCEAATGNRDYVNNNMRGITCGEGTAFPT